MSDAVKQESLPVVAGKLYELMHPLSSEDRNRVLQSALALLGPGVLPPAQSPEAAPMRAEANPVEFGGRKIGPAAMRWAKQHGVTTEMLEQVFHVDESGVAILATTLPGVSKKEQTVNAYVLVGIRALLASDSPTFSDKEGIAHCKFVGCYDKNNHTTNRNSAGSRMAGSRENGFTLPAPGLKAGAEIVRQIASAAA